MRTVRIWTLDHGRLMRSGAGLAEAAGLDMAAAAERSKRCREKKIPYIISLTGAGGKTAVMYQLAKELSSMGFRTAVTTTTHILMPEDGIHIVVPAEAKKMSLEDFNGLVEKADNQIGPARGFIVAGTAGSIYNGGVKKMTSLPPEFLNALEGWADILLVEADGSRRLPLKVPAEWEPVILPETSLVIGCAGLSAVGKPWREACFRSKYAERFFSGDTVTEESAAAILTDEWGTKKGVEGREYYIIVNQGDSEADRKKAEKILALVRGKCAGCCCTSFSGEN